MKKILILSSIILLLLWITVVFAQDAQQEKETRILAAISFQDVSTPTTKRLMDSYLVRRHA